MSPNRRGIGPDRRIFRVRGDDPPGWRFKVGILARRHPVVLACMVAICVLGFPVVGLVVQNGELTRQNGELTRQAAKLQRQNDAIRATQRGLAANRRAVAAALCRALNAQAVSNNGQNLYLQGIILGSAQRSKSFERVYRQFGLPSYEKRLATAQGQAAGLRELAVRKIDCARFQVAVAPRGGPLVIPYLKPEFPKLNTPPPLP